MFCKFYLSFKNDFYFDLNDKKTCTNNMNIGKCTQNELHFNVLSKNGIIFNFKCKKAPKKH